MFLIQTLIISMLASVYVALAIKQSFDPYPDLYEPNYLKRSFNESSLFTDDTRPFRLRDNVIPHLYKLYVAPNIMKDNVFTGEVEIIFQVKYNISSIELNQEDIDILSESLFLIIPDEENEIEIELQECEKDDQYQKLLCVLANEELVPENLYRIKFEYVGVIHNDMRGLYESYYFENQKKKVIGTTHFGQQTRRLMPCFDEPNFKAQFQLNIGRNPLLHPSSISNVNLQKTTNVREDWVIDEYKPTSVISTYLLAFVISDFMAISNDERDNHTFAVYARPNAIEQAAFAFQLGPKIIREFDIWNGISYYTFDGVEKMDIAAIPDFSAGAMENWGLLLHREANLLVDDHHTNTQQKQRIALVISHEIAHMWFGDLVTCDWFDAIWLNEGFATYFEFIALDRVHEDWKVMDDFVVSTMHNALSADAQESSHPLTNPGVNSYPEIRTLFSTITYDKGGSVLRMIHNTMGLDKFQNAIKEYLKKWQYKNVQPNNFFIELEKQDPSVNPERIMSSYTTQSGYPLINVVRGNNSRVTLTQKRFLINTIDHNINSKWEIPITFAKSKGDFYDKRAHLTLFKSNENSLSISFNDSSLNFYMFNIQQVGFYRVNYDEANWLAIGVALKSADHDGIHVLNRAQVVDDLFNLARAGYLPYNFILNIIDYIKIEKDYLPWYAALNGLSYLAQRIPNEAYKNDMFSFINNLTSDIYDQLDFKSDGDHQNKLNRINILNWACKYGNEKCKERALKEFDNAINKNQNIDPDWKPAVYCTGLRESPENWMKLWNRYLNTNYATEQTTILTALGCTKYEKELHAFLDKILTDEIRLQDKSTAYNRAYTGNLENIDIVFNYITKNHVAWSKVMDLASTLGDLANRFTNKEQVDKLEKFMIETKLDEDVKERLNSAIHRSRENLAWDAKRLVEVTSFFKNSGGRHSLHIFCVMIPILIAMIFVFFN